MTDTVPKLSPQLQKAAVIDTTLPYKNVQAAVRMFGEKSDNARLIQSHEKHEVGIRELKEELTRVRTQVVDEQRQRTSLLSELNALKKALETSLVHNNEISLCKDGELVGGLNVTTQQHVIVLAELEDMKTQKNRLEQELLVALQEKEHAQRQAEEALLAAEVNAKRAEELSKEILGTKESLLLVKMACVETNKEREALWAERKAQTSGRVHMASPGSPSKLNKLEDNLTEDRADFTKEDLRVLRRSLVSAREALANIDRLKAGCGSPLTDATIALELEAAKSEVCKALESDALLESTLKELQDKSIETKQVLDVTELKLVEMQSREASASAEIFELKLELERVKSELKAAISCNEAFVGFSQRLQKESTEDGEELTCKANDAAKAELHALLKEEAEAARQINPKISRDASVNVKRDRLETVYEDNSVILSQNEASNVSCDSHRVSAALALSPGMQVSFKEEHRKKKFSLLTFGTLLSKSKRRAQKGTSSTGEDL